MKTGVVPDLLFRHGRLATLDAAADYGVVGEAGDGVLAVTDGVISFLGVESDLPANVRPKREVNCEGRWLVPGLIDCHTHLVYAGTRALEFERRLEGVSYEQIAKEGGGIRSTVSATRAATVDQLVLESAPRLRRMMAEGLTTVEIKSGYGLDLLSERAMLIAARRLGDQEGVSVATTFLGAHAVPPEFEGRGDDYISYLIAEVLPVLHREGLVDAVDAFCETIGFTAEQVDRLFAAATSLSIPVKLHAEQLSDQGGTELLARYGGLSADHLEYVSDAGISALAASGAVAVLLPGAFYFLREKKVPPIAALRERGVPMAVSTDCNPGSSPLVSPLLAMNMACVQFRMTPLEALAGMTRWAAKALNLPDRGRLSVGLRADLALFDVERPGDLSYAMGANPLVGCWFGGVERS